MPRLLAVLVGVIGVLAISACATPEPPLLGIDPSAAAMGPAELPATPATVAAPSGPPPGPFAPEVSAELEPLPAPAEDLWARIRKGYAMPELDNPYVTKWEQWYASRPDYVARMIERSRRYLYHIVVEVEGAGLPSEVALLPMIESAYNPIALSTARAAGIWQFMPGTGKDYGMKQNFWFDSRRDVITATDGAIAYLQKLHALFNDWQLALAAYNWGEGNVGKAIERNQRAGKPTDYWSLAMPDETRNYLPKLQAVKNIINDPAKFNLELADIPDAPYFAVLRVSRPIDVKRAAELAEMSVEEFQYLNPHHNRPIIAGADEHAILLPIDKAELFAAKLDLSDQPLVSWQAYHLRPNETLPQVAAKFGLSVETLRAVNGIGGQARVPVGHVLLVPSQQPTSESEASLTQAVFTTVPQGRTFYYKVNKGDTVAGIAARYAVTTQDLVRWNDLGKRSLVVGQRLRITSDLAPNAAKATRASGSRNRTTTVKSTVNRGTTAAGKSANGNAKGTSGATKAGTATNKGTSGTNKAASGTNKATSGAAKSKPAAPAPAPRP